MTNAETNAPWQSEDCFPEKPAETDFGYLESGKLVPCSRDQLIERCSGLKRPEIDLVWHPDVPRLVPVWTVSFLGDALRQREKAVLKNNARVAAFNCAVFLVFAFFTHDHKGYFTLVAFFGFFMGIVPLFQSWRELKQVDSIRWNTDTTVTPFDRYAAWVESRSERITRLLLGVIGTVGLCQLLFNNTQSYWINARGLVSQAPHSAFVAGLVKDAVRQGQYWRLFTAIFLHGDIVHFIFNATALFGLGRLTEALAGRYRLALVFLVSALGGNLFSFLTMPQSVSIGASGGLLGLIGYLMVLGYRRKALLPPGFVRVFAINVVLVAVMGFAAFSIIDNAAHFGGFATGVAMGAFMVPLQGGLPMPESKPLKLAGLLALGVTLASALFAIFKIVT